MAENQSALESRLNAPDRSDRLAALAALADMERAGEIPSVQITEDVNNHIHTWYSFSPYSPAAAVWFAHRAGLSTAGIVDHDSVAGIAEFHEAGRIVGIATTGGMECRVRMTRTPVAGRRINNPDQPDVAYVAFHGIPAAGVPLLERFFAPLREKRNARNARMCARITERVAPFGLSLDFERDVLPVSKYAEGGSVTERHVLWALAKKLEAKFGRGEALIAFLEKDLGMAVSGKNAARLRDAESGLYTYDLLGVLKSDTSFFYLPAEEECPFAEDAVRVCREAGAICAYAYLGDVGDSVTGDKRAQTFEDAYLPELIAALRDLGFDAVTYMPSRNTEVQLDRLQFLCAANGFFEISGEDINSPRQSFVCVAARDERFAHLREGTWALIGHERRAAAGREYGLFGETAVAREPDLRARIADFAAEGRAL